jgi:S-adenosylmethionine-diacylglycerol 3-amino-3-carboxypropyl transferase
LEILKQRFFSSIHGGNLVYNACWEDPRLDRELMGYNGTSHIVCITSAGCNVLDYLLDDPAAIYSVDVNPRQNALLELKKSIFKKGTYEDLWALFGQGASPHYQEIYAKVRDELCEWSQNYWDKHIRFFDPGKGAKTFYYHGSAGIAAWALKNSMFTFKPKAKAKALTIFDAETIEQQREIFDAVEKDMWSSIARLLVRTPVIMAMLGVPTPQVSLIRRDFQGGLSGFIRAALRRVFTEIPIHDNYFWRVYFTGHYTPDCCPSYLKPENFDVLRERVGRIQSHTDTISGFLSKYPEQHYTHYNLLDHQDWLAWRHPDLLGEEWEWIFKQASPNAQVLMRSAALNVDFCKPWTEGRLQWRPELSAAAHQRCRIGTYGSTHYAVIA